ncbi:MAG TPA: DnaB-like helicase N-terminal domain-containing protein [Isosphaeraceae bacterium]|nr:DnaB-like helicase N-terminal domain-containing protein [Isosphaeraceae bacterium]
MTPFEDGNGDGHGEPIDGRWRPTIPMPADRLPPHSLESEKGVLGSVLLDNATLPEVLEVLKVEDFYRDSHQVIYRAIGDLYDRGLPVDLILLADELERRGQFDQVGGDEALAEILDGVPHAVNATFYAGVVRQKAIKRRLIEEAHETLREGYEDELTAEEFVERAERRLATTRSHADGPAPPRWPAPPAEEAWHGLAGDVVRRLAPHTEADPAAILVQFLVAFGNLVGHGPYWEVESTRHALNLFCCVVGNSSKARKGTSWDRVKYLLGGSDPDWSREKVANGSMSTGEGVLWDVRDPILRRKRKEDQRDLFEMIEDDPGVDDKRALCIESEFGGTLSNMAREGNNLSAIVRQLWDNGTIRIKTKNKVASATEAHVSIIGHITCEDLSALLSQANAANGFANRFLWVCARRSKYLPHGGGAHLLDFAPEHRYLAGLVEMVHAAAEVGGRGGQLLRRDARADALWEEVYPSLSEPRPGLIGSVVSRAEAQTMRLACIDALLDSTWTVGRDHLEAALALWRYCERSAIFIFGDRLSDPKAEKVVEALRAAGPAGVPQTRLRRVVFRGHLSGDEIGRVMADLVRAGLVECHEVAAAARGPKALTWYARGFAPRANA